MTQGQGGMTVASMFGDGWAARLEVAPTKRSKRTGARTWQADGIAIVSSLLAITIGDTIGGDVDVLARFVAGLAGGHLALLHLARGVKISRARDPINLGGLSARPDSRPRRGIFSDLRLIPVIGWLSHRRRLWTLAAMVVAVRQALDYKSLPRAIVVCVIGFIGSWRSSTSRSRSEERHVVS